MKVKRNTITVELDDAEYDILDRASEVIGEIQDIMCEARANALFGNEELIVSQNNLIDMINVLEILKDNYSSLEIGYSEHIEAMDKDREKED